MKLASFVAAAASLLVFGMPPVLAHDDAYLATQKAPNGGQLRMAGPYHYELVVSRVDPASTARKLVVYVTDHAGTPVPTQGARGVVHLLAGKERSTLKLEPDGENRMRGVENTAWTNDAKIVVSITMASAQPEQARFAADPLGASARQDASKASAAHGH